MSSRLLATSARPSVFVRAHARSITDSLPFPPSQNVPPPRQMPSALPWETAQKSSSTPRSSRSIPRLASIKPIEATQPVGGFQAQFDRMVKHKFNFDDEAVLNVLRTFIGKHENETAGTKDNSLIEIARQIPVDGDDKVYPDMISQPSPAKANSQSEGSTKHAIRVYRGISKELNRLPSLDPVYLSNEYNVDFNKKSWNNHFDAELAAIEQASAAQVQPIKERADEIAARLKALMDSKVPSSTKETRTLEEELRKLMKQMKELNVSLETSREDLSRSCEKKMNELEKNHRSYLKWMNDWIFDRQTILKVQSEQFKSIRPIGLSEDASAAKSAEPSNLLNAIEKTIGFHKDQMFYQQLEMLYLANRFRQISLQIRRPVLFKESFDLVVRTVTARRAPFNVSGPNTRLFQEAIRFSVARQLYRAMFALRSRPGGEANFEPLGPAIAYLETLSDLVDTKPDYILAKRTVLDVVSSVCSNLDGATTRPLLAPAAGLSGMSRSVSLKTRVEPISQFLQMATGILNRSSPAAASTESGMSKAQAKEVANEIQAVNKEFVLEAGGSFVQVKAVEYNIKRDLKKLETAIRKLA